MNSITALLHTQNDALRLGRCLETLYPCDEIVVVDHGSRDRTVSVAREYGARVVAAGNGGGTERYPEFGSGRLAWLFCLDPRESLTESLAASLYEWKTQTAEDGSRAFAVHLREETADGWIENPQAQTRLVRADWKRWAGTMPARDEAATVLEGEVLRFVFP